jgi:hypothetical protein
LVALAAVACGDTFGGAGGATGGAAGATAVSSASGGEPTACDLCAPLAVGEWNGPVLRLSGEEAANGCQASSPLRIGKLVEAPPAVCTCECLPACSKPAVSSASITGGSCAASAAAPTTLDYGCTNGALPAAASFTHFKVTSAPADACPARLAKTLDDPKISLQVALCPATVSSRSCSAGTCLDGTPLGDTGALCIFKDGVAECPADYPVRELLATTSEALVDGRGCSECSCGKPAGAEPCGVSLSAYESADCKGDSTGDKLTSKECLAVTKWLATAKSVFATLSGPTCEKSGGEPIGDAVPSDGAVTLCCLP